MPRPRVMNRANREIACRLLSAGATLDGVARFIGCTRRTILSEAKRDPEFRAALKQADMEGAMTILRQFAEASRKNWRASKWFLEQRAPGIYARRCLSR